MLRALVYALQLVLNILLETFLIKIISRHSLHKNCECVGNVLNCLLNLRLQFVGVCGGHISSLSDWLSGSPYLTEVHIS